MSKNASLQNPVLLPDAHLPTRRNQQCPRTQMHTAKTVTCRWLFLTVRVKKMSKLRRGGPRTRIWIPPNSLWPNVNASLWLKVLCYAVMISSLVRWQKRWWNMPFSEELQSFWIVRGSYIGWKIEIQNWVWHRTLKSNVSICLGSCFHTKSARHCTS